nr:putative ribonuclease H-like domain-containing protein [Tanacetum cinerariifolium]
ESTSSKPYEESISQVPEGSGNPNPTAFAFIPQADQMETLTVESPIPTKTDPALLQFCLHSCFLSQVEPKKVSDALQDPSWVEAMQEELL